MTVRPVRQAKSCDGLQGLRNELLKTLSRAALWDRLCDWQRLCALLLQLLVQLWDRRGVGLTPQLEVFRKRAAEFVDRGDEGLRGETVACACHPGNARARLRL